MKYNGPLVFHNTSRDISEKYQKVLIAKCSHQLLSEMFHNRKRVNSKKLVLDKQLAINSQERTWISLTVYDVPKYLANVIICEGKIHDDLSASELYF